MDDFQRHNSPRRSTQQSFQPRTRTERLGSRVSQMSGGGGGGRKGKYSRFFNKKWFILVGVTSLLLIIGGCSAVMLSASTYDIKDLDKLEFSTSVYDASGKREIGRIGSVYRENITMEQIKKHNPDLPMAFVKVEDQRFYQHSGVDWFGLGRAMVKNVIALGKGEGGGTITMQVARNVLLKDRTKTYTRKLKEISAALNIETKYPKDKILEVYLNYIDFGNQVAGIRMAAKIYFDKDIMNEKLEPQEIAFLAGLPKAPYGYNPYGSDKSRERALQRRNVVLMKMAEDNEEPPIITVEEKVRLQQLPLGTNEKYLEKYSKKSKYAAYINHVKQEIEDRYGLESEELNSGGYKIYTGMNVKAQETVEEAMEHDELFKAKEPYEGQVDSGVTILDAKSGLIQALGGGRNYKPGSRNRARELIAPGSSIKPLTVFAPAVEEKGYNPYTPVVDEKYSVGEWSPKNFSGRYYGQVTMDEVVYKSLNASAVKILMEDIKLDKSFEYGKEKFGLPLVDKDKGPASLALGGLTEGVNTIQMSQAFSAFPNNGKMVRAHTIIKIVNKDGGVVEPKDDQEIDDTGNAKDVISPTTAWYMTMMLRDVVKNPNGTAHTLASINRPMAGKTGTNNEENSAWFVGYTPDLVIAVNVFNDTVDGVKGTAKITGGSMPTKVAKYIMQHGEFGPAKEFKKPAGVKDPEPPFMLQAPQLSGRYQPESQSVQLNWQQQDSSRVVYTIQRSEDGTNFTDLQSGVKGNSYTDTNVQTDGGFLGQPKKYYYRVIARDTQATDESLATKESGVVTVTIKSKEEKEEKVPCDEFGLPIGCEKQENGGHHNGNNGDNGGENNGGGGHNDGGGNKNGGPPNGGHTWWNGGPGNNKDED
jgi:penicillin-binding protein 2A